VAAGTEVVPDGTEDRQEGLHVLGRLEALHHSLALANWKVRILSTNVQAFVARVIDVGQDLLDRRRRNRRSELRQLPNGGCGERSTEANFEGSHSMDREVARRQ
jgi:hypothetical protein